MNKHEMAGLRKIVTDHQREYLATNSEETVPEGIMYALQSDYRIFKEVLLWTDITIQDYIDDIRQDIQKGNEVRILK